MVLRPSGQTNGLVRFDMHTQQLVMVQLTSYESGDNWPLPKCQYDLRAVNIGNSW